MAEAVKTHDRRERAGRTITVRLTHKLAQTLEIDLDQVSTGDVLTLPNREARVLIAQGWATRCAPHAERSHAADRSYVVQRAGNLGLDESLMAECALADAARLNTMFAGPPALVEHALAMLSHRFDVPVLTATCDRRFLLEPATTARTLIMHDIDRLSPSEQRQLLNWMEQVPSRPRIISTVRGRLLTPLPNETFLDVLYYRLNTVYVDLRGR